MKRDIVSGNASDIFCLSFNSDPMSVRTAIQAVNFAIGHLKITIDELTSIEIVLTEVTNNIVEHAYQKIGGKPIDLRVCHHPVGLKFEFVDHGLAMPNGKIPADVALDLDCPVADLPEGGFGWPLIHRLVSGFEYTRVGDENHLRFFFSVRDSAETD